MESRWLPMGPLLAGIALHGLATTLLTPALPAIGAELGLGARDRLWVVDVVPLAVAALLVSAARVADLAGRRTVLIAGLGGYGICTVGVAVAGSGELLIAGRIGVGVFAGAILAAVVATIGTVYDGRDRVVAYGLWTGMFGATQGLGPVTGGLLVGGVGWRTGQLVCAGLAFAAAVVTWWLVPQTNSEAPVRLDRASIAYSVAGLALFVAGMKELVAHPVAGTVAAALGTAGLVAFGRRQLRMPVPFLDLRILTRPGFLRTWLRIVASAGTSAAAVFLTTQYLIVERGRSPAEAGLALVPHAAGVILGGLGSPVLSRWKSLVVAAMALQVLSLGWLALAGTGPVLAGLGLAGVGLGLGVIGTVGAAALFDLVPRDAAGQVGALQETGFALGSGLGIAGFGLIAVAGGYATAVLAAGVCLGLLLVSRSRRGSGS